MSIVTLYSSLKDIPYQQFAYYQNLLEPVIMQACGYGFILTVNADLPPITCEKSHLPDIYPHQSALMTDFLNLKRSSLSCSDVHLLEKTCKNF